MVYEFKIRSATLLGRSGLSEMASTVGIAYSFETYSGPEVAIKIEDKRHDAVMAITMSTEDAESLISGLISSVEEATRQDRHLIGVEAWRERFEQDKEK